MQDEITVERSLLYIQQHHIDQFKSTTQQMKEFDYLIKNGGLHVKDAWIIAFNVWLLFLPDKENIFHSAEKTLYYPANSLLLKELMNNSAFQQFKRYHQSKEVLYIASLTIANGINEWIYTVMEKYNLMDINERAKERTYFDAHLGNSEDIKLLAVNQARFVKASVIELQSDSFNEMLIRCCNEALNISLKSNEK